MNRRKLKNIVKETYDKAMLEGACDFTVDARELYEMKIERISSVFDSNKAILVKLNFGSGYLQLCPNDFTRSQMINLFTRFIWEVFYEW